ncbi:NUMOD3 domain-containing DNA-binding protein [Bacillus altitudinis]|uniref:NUMOD3 domain-containing DNA-binding protein n=1 Tax=Bacillus altitudinis TaxID=293387 RepID=UPI001F1FDDC6|nr:NUMOD3 domain-containing DNA-binding protein [Bacillus altitudinis]
MNAVYRIINKHNGKYYIGSSSNFLKRKRSHFNMLRRGAHHNKPLQADYNKHGEGCFLIEVLKIYDEKTTRKELFEKEQDYIFASDNRLLYNLYDNAFGMSYKKEKNPMFGKTHSPKVKAMLSEINSGENNFWYGNDGHMNKMRSKITKRFDGRRHTEKTKLKMSKSHKGREKTSETRLKLSLNNGNNSSIVIEGTFYRSMSEASRQLNISRTTITSRVNNPKFKNYSRCSEGVETN